MPHATPRPQRLCAEDWIARGLQTLIESGIEAVQITALARRLDVTRGSFYWHFESREALLDALLTHWRRQNTGVMIESLDDAESLDSGILALFSVWVDDTRFDPKLDQAVRDWARHSDTLHSTVKSEDDARVDAIAAFYARHGYEQPEAFIRARVLYYTQVSYYALATDKEEDMTDRLGYLEAYFRVFTGRDIDPEIARAYRAETLGASRP